MRVLYPALFCERYKLTEIPEDMSDYDLFLTVGRKRGCLIAGGEVNTERVANLLLDEFRGAKIGRITLDRVEKPTKENGYGSAGTNH